MRKIDHHEAERLFLGCAKTAETLTAIWQLPGTGFVRSHLVAVVDKGRVVMWDDRARIWCTVWSQSTWGGFVQHASREWLEGRLLHQIHDEAVRAASAVLAEPKQIAPPRITDIERYWMEPPPERSARCVWWEQRIRAGWRRNRRIGALGYYSAARYFGVYLWEWLKVLSPLLQELKAADVAAYTLGKNGNSEMPTV